MKQNKLLKEAWKQVSEEKIVGGLADNKSLGDIARKHAGNNEKAYVTLFYLLKDQLQKGIAVELEHTNDKKIAQEIALDHLAEDPDYYTKLAKANLEEMTINENASTMDDTDELLVVFDDSFKLSAEENAKLEYDDLYDEYVDRGVDSSEIPSLILNEFQKDFERSTSLYGKATSELNRLYADLYRLWEQSTTTGAGTGGGSTTYSISTSYFPFAINYSTAQELQSIISKNNKFKHIAQYEIFKLWYDAPSEKRLAYLKRYMNFYYNMFNLRKNVHKGRQLKESGPSITVNPGNIPRKIQGSYNPYLSMIKSKFEEITYHDSNKMLISYSPSTTKGVLLAMFGQDNENELANPFIVKMESLKEKYGVSKVDEIPAAAYEIFYSELNGPNGKFFAFIISSGKAGQDSYVTQAFKKIESTKIEKESVFKLHFEDKTKVDYAMNKVEESQANLEENFNDGPYPLRESKSQWRKLVKSKVLSESELFHNAWIEKANKLIDKYSKTSNIQYIINAIVAFGVIEKNLRTSSNNTIGVVNKYKHEFNKLLKVFNTIQSELPEEMINIVDNILTGKELETILESSMLLEVHDVVNQFNDIIEDLKKKLMPKI